MATRIAPVLRYSPNRLPPGYQTLVPGEGVILPVLTFLAMLLPAGLAANVGGLALPPYRIALLALAPFAIIRLASRKVRPMPADFLFVASSVWVPLAYYMNTGIDKAFEGGGSFVIDSLGSYLIGRAYITDVRHLRTFLKLALPGVIIIAALLFVEATTHKLLIADLFPTRARLGKLYEVRLGLLRARATFPHSVSAGIFMTSLLPLYYFSGLRPTLKWVGTIASLFAFFTVSSSAILTIALTVFLIGYRTAFNFLLKMRERMIYLVYAFAALFVTLEIFTGRGAIRTLIEYFTLDKSSGYYRLLIWDYGTASVNRHPVFGIGDASMPRPKWMVAETIDNHWLALAVKYGLPCAILTLLGVILAVWYCSARNRGLNDFDRATTAGAIFSLTTTAAVAWTGGLWANNIAWFMFIASVVVALSDQLPRRPQQVRRLVRQAPVRLHKPD